MIEAPKEAGEGQSCCSTGKEKSRCRCWNVQVGEEVGTRESAGFCLWLVGVGMPAEIEQRGRSLRGIENTCWLPWVATPRDVHSIIRKKVNSRNNLF
jgi:hypothetical protein